MTTQFLIGFLGLLGGTAGAKLIDWLRERRKDQLVSLDMFYATWKQEMARLHNQITNLEMLLEALSDELESLGGDPTKVRNELERQRRERSVAPPS